MVSVIVGDLFTNLKRLIDEKRKLLIVYGREGWEYRLNERLKEIAEGKQIAVIAGIRRVCPYAEKLGVVSPALCDICQYSVGSIDRDVLIVDESWLDDDRDTCPFGALLKYLRAGSGPEVIAMPLLTLVKIRLWCDIDLSDYTLVFFEPAEVLFGVCKWYVPSPAFTAFDVVVLKELDALNYIRAYQELLIRLYTLADGKVSKSTVLEKIRNIYKNNRDAIETVYNNRIDILENAAVNEEETFLPRAIEVLNPIVQIDEDFLEHVKVLGTTVVSYSRWLYNKLIFTDWVSKERYILLSKVTKQLKSYLQAQGVAIDTPEVESQEEVMLISATELHSMKFWEKFRGRKVLLLFPTRRSFLNFVKSVKQTSPYDFRGTIFELESTGFDYARVSIPALGMELVVSWLHAGVKLRNRLAFDVVCFVTDAPSENVIEYALYHLN